MSWSDSYEVVWCPKCQGAGSIPNMDGVTFKECKTCKGLRKVRIPETSFPIYDPVYDTEDD